MNILKSRSKREPATGTPKKVWVIDFFYADEHGVRRRYRRDARVQTKTAAEAEAKRLFVAATTKGAVPGNEEPELSDQEQPPRYTFADAVADWKRAWVKKHTTCEGYEINLVAHLMPRFRDRSLGSLRYEDVSTLRAALKDRAVATVNNIEVALRSVLRLAVAHGKLPVMPKLPPLRPVPKKVIVPPTLEEVEAVLGVAYPAAKLAIALAAYAGLRSGEIRALRFRDVDLKSRLICVRAAISRGVEGPPKSGHQREIPISAPLVAVLEAEAQRPHKPEDFVALSSRRKPWGEGSLLHAFHSVLKGVKLPPKRLHDLRHFFVTECFQAGIAAPDVQQLAGHLHLQVTQGYAHSDKRSRKAAIEKFEKHLASSRESSGNSVETEAASEAASAGGQAEKPNDSGPKAA